MQKLIKEERAIEELKRQQVKAGLMTESEGARIEWMYKAPLSKPSTNDYLLGAPIKDESKVVDVVRANSKTVGASFQQEHKSNFSSYIGIDALCNYWLRKRKQTS